MKNLIRKILREEHGRVILREQSNENVYITGKQPYPNGTDWDLVHGILGSKRLDDDLEEFTAIDAESSDYKGEVETLFDSPD